MSMIVGGIVGLILTGLALLHLYWAGGGRFAALAAVPEVSQKPVFTASPGACILVALFLGSAAAIVVMQAGLWAPSSVPRWVPALGSWVLAAIFALRALGDFRLVGFFKRVRGTRFARMDTVLYSPLSVLLAVGCGWVASARGSP